MTSTAGLENTDVALLMRQRAFIFPGWEETLLGQIRDLHSQIYSYYILQKKIQETPIILPSGMMLKARLKTGLSGQFSAPDSVTFAEGCLYVADPEEEQIFVFSQQGRLIRTFGQNIRKPIAITLDLEGNIVVLNNGTNSIQVYDPLSGDLLVAHAPFPDDKRYDPIGIVVDHSGNFLISDFEQHIIRRVSPAGKVIGSIGSPGSGFGQLRAPVGLAVDIKGTIWVADSGNNRISRFTSIGFPLCSYGEDSFQDPWAVAVGQDGVFVVSDMNHYRLQIWGSTDEGDFRGFWQSNIRLDPPGTDETSLPRGLSIAPDGTIYVADWGNGEILVVGQYIY